MTHHRVTTNLTRRTATNYGCRGERRTCNIPRTFVIKLQQACYRSLRLRAGTSGESASGIHLFWLFMVYVTTSLIPKKRLLADRMFNEYWIDKDVEGSGRGLCCTSAGGTVERYQNLSPNRQSPGRGFNPRSPIYEAEVLTTLWTSV